MTFNKMNLEHQIAFAINIVAFGIMDIKGEKATIEWLNSDHPKEIEVMVRERYRMDQ